MVRWLAVVAVVVAAMGWGGTVRAQAPEPFVIGVAPHASADVIAERYQPVCQALSTALRRPVTVATAPDFTEFARRAAAQHYDLAVTTGHQAEMLRADAKYLPLLTYKADFRAVLVVDRQSPMTKPRALDNTLVLGLNPSSLVTQWGLHWLRDHHVKPREVRHVTTSDSMAQLIMAGEATGGFMSLATFQRLPLEVQMRLRIQESSPPMAGRVYMLNSRHAALRGKVVGALNAFAETDEGRRYFVEAKLEGYREVGAAELETMAPYADEVREVLRGGAGR